MTRLVVFTTTTAVALAALLATSAVAAPAAVATRAQGGVGAGFNSIGPYPSQMTGEQRQLMREVRALRSEARAAMRQNGGALPEAERVALQERLEMLKAALRQAG